MAVGRLYYTGSFHIRWPIGCMDRRTRPDRSSSKRTREAWLGVGWYRLPVECCSNPGMFVRYLEELQTKMNKAYLSKWNRKQHTCRKVVIRMLCHGARIVSTVRRRCRLERWIVANVWSRRRSVKSIWPIGCITIIWRKREKEIFNVIILGGPY